MALEFDSCRCVRSPLQRRATEEELILDDRESSFKRKTEFAFEACKKIKKKHKSEKKSSDEVRGRRKSKEDKCDELQTKPEAPFNSTQFLMEEHDYLSDSDLSTDPTRQREPSVSMDSDDPEDISAEDVFLTKEFWSAYEDVEAERLDTIPKYQLVQEFLSLEEKISALERELNSVMKKDKQRIREPSPADEEEETHPPGEVPVDAETAAKIEIFTSEIKKLDLENKGLRLEKNALRRPRICLRCGFPPGERAMTSSSDSSDEDDTDEKSIVVVNSRSLKYVTFESNTDSGVASFEGNTSSSSEELLKEESRQYVPDKSSVSSTTL